jgi:nucleoside 2-deoxyribosyltransferase
MTPQHSKPILYLAGPCGFSEIGRIGLASIETLLKEKYEVINPFTKSADEGQRIGELEKKLIGKTQEQNDLTTGQIKQELAKISMDIGQKNAEFIKSADRILAILDGSDVDSGTAAEIGYAFALGKHIDGYRSDFRYAGDNFGSEINLQVEYFIRASGGTIFHTIEELK